VALFHFNSSLRQEEKNFLIIPAIYKKWASSKNDSRNLIA